MGNFLFLDFLPVDFIPVQIYTEDEIVYRHKIILGGYLRGYLSA